MTSEWMPIESAPRDGTVFLATDGRQVYAVSWGPAVKGLDFPWVIFEGAFFHGLSGCCDNEDDERIAVNGWTETAPTLWMPLPTPPVVEQSHD